MDESAFERFMGRLSPNSQETSKGVRLSFTIYVYPDGTGSLYFLKPDSKTIDEPGRWVSNSEQAVEAFRVVWEQAANHPN